MRSALTLEEHICKHGRTPLRRPGLQTLVLYFILFLVTIMLFVQVTFAVLQYATAGLGSQDSTPQALNPQLTNTIPDNGGPVLYYNGSGDVPP